MMQLLLWKLRKKLCCFANRSGSRANNHTSRDTSAAQGAGSIFNRAELVLTDAKARERLVDSTKDQLVDFLLTFVPDMSIPDYEDIQNDVDYAIADLDISWATTLGCNLSRWCSVRGQVHAR